MDYSPIETKKVRVCQRSVSQNFLIWWGQGDVSFGLFPMVH